ncbi:hypothetical protein JMJ35_004528 [Cladonia borealis]|uniref:F-box domain-containing protein n=1 Tax=Cladonia borealis TaxID=184061 RepID=A0AA39R315_9LECA|nr:hypothetical protein JMJ35_004528 [Cladonia borealis]
MTPPPANNLEEGVECSGWTKPAASGNQYIPPAILLRSNCLFFKLPPELRLKIYSDLIRSGNLEVLRLCQKIHKEAIGIFFRDGIYRVRTKEDADLYFGDAASPGAQNETNRIRKEVQNVEVYTDLKNITNIKMLRLSRMFPDMEYPQAEWISPKISGKNCWIYLTHHDMTTEMHLDQRLAILIRAVRQFDNVFLNFSGMISLFNDPSGSFIKTELMQLGPPTWRNDPDPAKRYLIFHPR